MENGSEGRDKSTCHSMDKCRNRPKSQEFFTDDSTWNRGYINDDIIVEGEKIKGKKEQGVERKAVDADEVEHEEYTLSAQDIRRGIILSEILKRKF